MKKMLGEDRRHELLHILKTTNEPITGTDLANHANVSRQVIVNDMNLLKARNEPIIATSQGYVYLKREEQMEVFERKIVCLHTAAQAEDEMLTIVDCGVTLKSVSIDHPVYGEITASMMLSNRHDVKTFLHRISKTQANYLSVLTDGTHLHEISASSEELLDRAEHMLRAKGYLVEE
ncbi:transcription repressor NadR [Ureibacillus sp. GCM10028918]|uniref:transcription repressor NadR n=1 Tax=Ureibacillus sp. GCM10028918 TaxID=3273429 RepID=UPI003611975B